MNNFDYLHEIFDLVNQAEGKLKILRDNVDTPTKSTINAALLSTSQLRDNLWRIDSALAAGKGV